MKKRCTNPACRRVFTPRAAHRGVVCPHCGKVYPRASYSGEKEVYLELYQWMPHAQKLSSIKRLRTRAGLGLRQAKEILDRLDQKPYALGPMSLAQAAQEQTQWAQMGIRSRFLSLRDKAAVSDQPEHTYRLILTGYAPGSAAKTARQIRSVTGLSPKQCADFVLSLRHGPVTLATGLAASDARTLLDKVRAKSITARLEWDKRAS